MIEVLHHVLLALAVLAVAQAAVRAAALVAPGGLERAIVAAVTAVGATVAAALALGLAGLGGSTVVVAAASGLMWLAARALLPDPVVPPSRELAAWWRARDARTRLAVAAALGAAAAWLVWQLRYPAIGFDSALYHYPFVAGWLENGRPGTGLELSYDIPYGSYPLTDEVAQTWWAAVARSWVPLALWTPALVALLGAAAWSLLRNLAVPRLAAGLGAAVMVSLPLVVRQLNEAQTDLPALSWLACAGALATGAGRRPALLVPALVAVGLAVGTKPSTGPLAVAALAVGAWAARAHLRRLAGPLALGVAGAVVVGGVWYVRNLVEHGSPLWPFAPGPFGDPAPSFIGLVDATFLERPGPTLEGRVGEYEARLAGGILLLAGSLLAVAVGLVARRERQLRRPLVVAGALALGGTLIWSMAWGTGLPTNVEVGFPGGFVLSGIRYLLPAVGAAVVAVALLARSGGPPGRVAVALLAGAVVWNVAADARLGAPWSPPLTWLVAGALVGAAAAAVAERVRLPRLLPAGAAAVVATVVAGAALAVPASGFIERYAHLDESTAYGRELVRWFLDQPGFEDGDEPIAIASRGVLAQLAGDRFEHELRLVPQRASCAEVEAIARRMPVVVTPTGFFLGNLGVEGYSAPACLRRHRPVFEQSVYAVYRLPPA